MSTRQILTTILTVTVLATAMATTSFAAPEKGGKKCNDGIDNDGDGDIDGADSDCSEGTGSEPACQIDFDAVFDDLGLDGVRSDGKGAYSAFTGSGPGFRLDTNGSQKLERKNDDRKVTIDFSSQPCSGGWFENVGFCEELKGIDMRFDLTTGGLDLCSLPAGGESGSVTLHLGFLAADNSSRVLSYGCLAGEGGPVIGNSAEAAVARIDGTTWYITGQSACLRDGGIFGSIVDGTDDNPLSVPFGLTITAVGAP
jgi:hypothetical protein